MRAGAGGTLHPHLWAAALVNLKFPSLCSLTPAQQPLEGAVSSQFWLSLPPRASPLASLEGKENLQGQRQRPGRPLAAPKPTQARPLERMYESTDRESGLLLTRGELWAQCLASPSLGHSSCNMETMTSAFWAGAGEHVRALPRTWMFLIPG